MKGFLYFVIIASISILVFAFNSLFGILIALLFILDMVLQGFCGLWKRLDKIIEELK